MAERGTCPHCRSAAAFEVLAEGAGFRAHCLLYECWAWGPWRKTAKAAAGAFLAGETAGGPPGGGQSGSRKHEVGHG